MKQEKVVYHRRKVMRVGGSVVVPLPRELRQDLSIGVGDYVTLCSVNEYSILIKRERKPWNGRVKKSD